MALDADRTRVTRQIGILEDGTATAPLIRH